MMFGSILFAGFGMMARTGFSQRNMVIVSLSLSVGLGFTSATGMFNIFPEIVRTVFADNCVAVVFLLAVIPVSYTHLDVYKRQSPWVHR